MWAPTCKKIAVSLTCLALAACGTTSKLEPRIEYRDRPVPTPVPCAVNVTEPGYVDTDEALAGAANIFELAKLYKAGRLQRLAALEDYRAAVKGCSR